jgi:hypothetical protein
MTLDQFKPGVRVFVYIDAHQTKMLGTAGQGWQAGGSVPIVKFDDDNMVFVTKENARYFHLEPSN